MQAALPMMVGVVVSGATPSIAQATTDPIHLVPARSPVAIVVNFDRLRAGTALPDVTALLLSNAEVARIMTTLRGIGVDVAKQASQLVVVLPSDFNIKRVPTVLIRGRFRLPALMNAITNQSRWAGGAYARYRHVRYYKRRGRVVAAVGDTLVFATNDSFRTVVDVSVGRGKAWPALDPNARMKASLSSAAHVWGVMVPPPSLRADIAKAIPGAHRIDAIAASIVWGTPTVLRVRLRSNSGAGAALLAARAKLVLRRLAKASLVQSAGLANPFATASVSVRGHAVDLAVRFAGAEIPAFKRVLVPLRR